MTSPDFASSLRAHEALVGDSPGSTTALGESSGEEDQAASLLLLHDGADDELQRESSSATNTPRDGAARSDSFGDRVNAVATRARTSSGGGDDDHSP